MDFFSEILAELDSNKITTRDELELAKKRLAKKHGLSSMPDSVEILAHATKHYDLLITKPSRSLSGVSVVAIMANQDCPGECVYCPRGDAAQSYTGFEPAAMRGQQNQFDAAKQVENRLAQLRGAGHPTDKIEMIIMGSTFTAMQEDFQNKFVLNAFNALNEKPSTTISEAQKLNETAKHRCVGLTFELRPDYCDVQRILSFGATRVELGVQTVYNDVYEKVLRGHKVEDVVAATKQCKDSFLKVGYHVMPGLPGSDFDRDVEMFKELFSNEDFMPDMLKIYPCVLAKKEFYKDKTIHEWYERGEWSPLSNDEAAKLLTKARKFFPPWMRVMRIQRDIPAPQIEAGVTASNLRQLVQGECECIRCREIRDEEIRDPKLVRREYRASEGDEVFLSFEERNRIIAFLRLRACGTGVGVRELRVYGKETEIGKKGDSQHRGFGSKLLETAERVAKAEFDAKELKILAGVGVRPYYYARGYELKKPFVVKSLRSSF